MYMCMYTHKCDYNYTYITSNAASFVSCDVYCAKDRHNSPHYSPCATQWRKNSQQLIDAFMRVSAK